MADRERADISQHPPKRRKINNMPSQSNLPTSIMLSNPHIRPESSSDRITISRFSQELSVFVNGTDIRFKLSKNAQGPGDERLLRLIFHHPLLSLPYHESYFQPTPLVNAGHEHQRPNLSVSESSSNLPRDSPTSSKSDCADLLENVRTTPDESSFLHTMLELSAGRNKDSDEDRGNFPVRN